MAFCDIEQSFLGKKLNRTFFPQNRNRIANLISDPEFKQWFGNGRKDKDGNPVLDETLSFTNEQGKKKTVFDFPVINFQNTGEVHKVLTHTSKAISLHKGDLFIDNTSKKESGEFRAKDAMRLINTVNYYYPDLLTIEIYKRKGLGAYSKDSSIPLPVLKVDPQVPLINTPRAFSVHDTNLGNKDSGRYAQLRSVQALETLKDAMDEFRVYGLSEGDLKKISENPEITEQTYEGLKNFLKKINPEFKIEEIDGLSTAGVAYINQFMIEVDKEAKLKAMPEEAAHFFLELLPKDNPLRKEMLDNITSFSIYSTTLQTYKDNPEYQTSKGAPNYDKIKREAAAKLISEYVYALSTGDQSRIELLTRTKKGWLQRWWERFLKFIRGFKQVEFDERLKAYIESANAILNENVEWLTLEQSLLDSNNDIFFSLHEANRVTMATTMMSQVIDAGNVERLQKVINSFRRDLAKNFINIVKNDALQALNKELIKQEDTNTDVNYLGELYDILKNVKVQEKDVNLMMSADNQIINLTEFLNVVANMQRLAKAIDVVSDKYLASGDYMKNIYEIQSFRDIYTNFRSFINSDLIGVLGESGVGADILSDLRNMTTIFDGVEVKLLKKLRENYAVWMKNTVEPQNRVIINELTKRIERHVFDSVQDPAKRAEITKALDTYIRDLQGNKTKLESQQSLMRELDRIKVPKKVINSTVMSEIWERVGDLYTTNMAINDLLNGLGKDIDIMSSTSHLITAAIKNRDSSVSNIAKFILDKRSNAHNLAARAMRSLQSKVDPILKELKSGFNMDEYTAGEAITYIDEIEDLSTNPDTGNLNYPDGRRKIVKFLDPVLQAVWIENDRLFTDKNKIRAQWKAATPGTAEAKILRDQFIKIRKEYIAFNSKYFNSPFKQELIDFQNKWNSDQDFLDIKEEWDDLSAREKAIWDLFEGNKDVLPDYKTLTEIQQQKNALLNERGRTGKDLEQIQLLKKYFEESSKYRVEDKRRTYRNFVLAKNQYESKLDYAINDFKNQTPESQRTLDSLEDFLIKRMRDPTLRIKYKYIFNALGNDDVSQDLLIKGAEEIALVKTILVEEVWASKNSVKVRNQKYYDEQEKLSKEIQLLKDEKGLSKLDEYISDLYDQMHSMLISRKNQYGQKDPTVLTTEELDSLIDLENKINRIKNLSARSYKITEEAKNDPKNQRYIDHIEQYEEYVEELYNLLTGTSSNPDREEFLAKEIKGYNKDFAEVGILTRDQLDASAGIRDRLLELSKLSDKTPTEKYLDEIQQLIPIMEQILEEAQNRDRTNMSRAQIEDLDIEIEKLRVLIGDTDNKGGLIEAIHGGNYQLLDEILNDEYFVTVFDRNKNTEQRVLIEFKKYIEVRDEVDIPSKVEEFNPEFFDWFHAAHTPGRAFVDEEDPFTHQIMEKSKAVNRDYTRRMIFTYSQPSDDRPDLFELKPSKRYFATKINDDPETGFIKKQVTWKDSNDMEDWTVTNREGNPQYLPLSRKQRLAKGDSSTEYLNKDFYKLKDAKDRKSTLLKSYMDTSIRTYLEEQDTKSDDVKAWLNLPVTNLDSFQRDKAFVTNLPDRIKRLGQQIKGVFTKSTETDAEDQLLGIDQIRDVDEFTQEIIQTKIPRLGMNVKLPVERVNRNVLHALEMYIYKSKDFDARSDLRPFVKGIIDIMQANEANPHQRNQKKRAEIFNKIYEQMVLEELPDNISNLRGFRKISNILMKFTALKITMDAVGGAINYVQANINNLIEAFAGQYVSPRSYANGYAKATTMLGHMVMDFTKKSDYHYWTLMFQTFDFVQGEWLEDLLERSATKNKTFDWRTMTMWPRKNGELHAQSTMAIAILDNNKITNTIDGKKYPMWDIYKKEGDHLVLKEGFDPILYNPINGTEFIRVRDLIWSINLDLHGNYAKLTQTEASRHSVGKLAENMKRWFVAGFQRRFGRESFDVNKQDLDEGFYRTTGLFVVKTLGNLLRLNVPEAKSQFRHFFNTPKKRQNLQRAAAEATMSAMLFMLFSFGFGYDDDDPDRNKKLQQSSWLHNELLLITLRTYAEQTAYIPSPPWGFTELSRNLLDPFSVVKSSFTNAAGALVLSVYTAGYYLGIDQLENDALYQKDTGGRFAQKGDLKLVTYLMKTFGYTGSQLDPAYYIKNYEAMQNRLK